MKERLEAVVSGRVQMVMFRDFAQRKAKGLKLVGEVQNLKDGTVRVVAEGERPALDSLVEKLQKGPFLADVSNVATVFAVPTEAFTKFTIRYE